jgi:chaperonin GroES
VPTAADGRGVSPTGDHDERRHENETASPGVPGADRPLPEPVRGDSDSQNRRPAAVPIRPTWATPGDKEAMKVQPLHDRILVKRIDEEQKTKGGIIIPDTAKEKPQEGKVIAVGKGRVLDDGKVQELAVKKGDKILFSKYAGTDIKVDGDDHIIIREDDVLAILE